MLYVEPVYRPPSEAQSLLVQATIGCASAARGQCFFCGSWLLERALPQKRFRVRPVRDIVLDLEEARRELGPGVSRVFFLDSNALVMKTGALQEVTQRAHALFPALERVSVYACAADILRKSHQELVTLKEAGLKLLYVGLESGNDDVLRLHNKGATAGEIVEACQRARSAALEVSVTVILGLGGRALSRHHALDTARAVSEIQPDYLGALTLMVVPGTPVEKWIARGTFEPLSQEEILEELGVMVEGIEGAGPVVFRTNHASNYLPLKGTLPADKHAILSVIAKAQRRAVPLRPEHLRGL